MWVALDKNLYTAHLEISRKAYWTLVKEAAELEKDPEEYLEDYINTLWGEATPVEPEQL